MISDENISKFELEKILNTLKSINSNIEILNGSLFEGLISIAALVITILLGVITIRQHKISIKQFDILTKTNDLANKQQRISMIENNLDVLQRLNELALTSPENLEAAFTSVNKTDERTGKYDEKAARKVFFHYLRINRMYRVWLLKENKLMDDAEYRLIVDNYAGTLKRAQTQMNLLSQRGYDERFIQEISTHIENAPEIEPIILDENLVLRRIYEIYLTRRLSLAEAKNNTLKAVI